MVGWKGNLIHETSGAYHSMRVLIRGRFTDGFLDYHRGHSELSGRECALEDSGALASALLWADKKPVDDLELSVGHRAASDDTKSPVQESGALLERKVCGLRRRLRSRTTGRQSPA